jgi:thiamine pyrophosphate-dependent acetolactate synthase large subunit-like protein
MLLEGANRPMIMVGAGAINAGANLRAIAERLGAPVVSHLQGRGILDSRHPLSIGRAEAFGWGVPLTSLWRSERVSTVRAGDGD